MIHIENPIDNLPPYFKEEDTYKDGNGKGILERFLNTLGQYLSDDILQPLKDEQHIIKLAASSPRLVNFIWELFSFIPYSYGVLLDNNKQGLYDKSNPEAWVDVDTDLKPRAAFRDLLSYAVQLYKIRGTLEFYPTLLKFYGYSCTVVDISGTLEDPDSLVSENYIPYMDSGLNMDEEVTMDISDTGSRAFSTIELSITIDHENTSDFRTRLYLLLNHFRPVYINEFNADNVTIIIN